MGDRWWRFVGVGNAIALIATAFGLSFASTAVAEMCPNSLFRTGAGADLPDCRAYERASPADKNGGAVEGFPDLLTAASGGSSVTFFTQAGTGIPGGAGATQDFGTYMARREGETWSTQRLMPPQSLGPKGHYLGTTSDQHFAFVEASRYASESDPGRGLFMIDTTDGLVETIVPRSANREAPPEYSFFFYGYAIDGASTDGSRVLFETRAQLSPDAAPGVDNLYLWSRATREVTLAGVLPSGEGGEAPAGGSFGGAHEWFFENELSQGGALSGLAVQALNAVAPDATQAFFTAGETGQLFLRGGLGGASPETVRISAPNPGVVDPNGERPAAFQEATPDGKKAFFLSSGKLTADANTGSSDEGNDLYMWSSAAEPSLVDVAPDSTDALGAQVQGVLGISDDGTSGYFVARGVLATGAQSGADNLYRFDMSSAPPIIEFIATLESGSAESKLPDIDNWSPRSYHGPSYATESFVRASRVSSNGRTLLFSSIRPLTGYDNTNPDGSECIASQCAEIFKYTLPPGVSSEGSLTCVSCDTGGSSPLGSAHLQSDLLNGGVDLPEGAPLVSFPSNLSTNGERIFFESPDPLVSADTNGASGCPAFKEGSPGSLPACQDVYEWEAPGTPGGSCVSAEVAEGCLYLLSTGKSTAPSFFAGASSDGQVAFIVTASPLVPSDTDTANDAYAVRVGGGLAAQFSVPSSSCFGEDCLASPFTSPAAPAIGSANVEGPGNPKAKHKHRRHKHKKHRHRGHKQQKRKKSKRANRDGRAHMQSLRLGGKG